MKLKQLTLVKTDSGFEVFTDGHRTGRLSLDEALGCIASALFGGEEKMPMFMETDLKHALTERRYRGDLDDRDRAALIEAGLSLTEPEEA